MAASDVAVVGPGLTAEHPSSPRARRRAPTRPTVPPAPPPAGCCTPTATPCDDFAPTSCQLCALDRRRRSAAYGRRMSIIESDRLRHVLASIPPGGWMSYGDV